MKRTCGGCRAYNSQSCDLGYNIEVRTMGNQVGGAVIGAKPLEDCLKPRTMSEYVYAMGIYRKSLARKQVFPYSNTRTQD